MPLLHLHVFAFLSFLKSNMQKKVRSVVYFCFKRKIQKPSHNNSNYSSRISINKRHKQTEQKTNTRHIFRKKQNTVKSSFYLYVNNGHLNFNSISFLFVIIGIIGLVLGLTYTWYGMYYMVRYGMSKSDLSKNCFILLPDGGIHVLNCIHVFLM